MSQLSVWEAAGIEYSAHAHQNRRAAARYKAMGTSKGYQIAPKTLTHHPGTCARPALEAGEQGQGLGEEGRRRRRREHSWRAAFALGWPPQARKVCQGGRGVRGLERRVIREGHLSPGPQGHTQTGQRQH